MAEGGGDGRRREVRVPAPGELEVLVESFGKFLEQHAGDISLGGMFLRSPAPPPVGTRVRFAFRLRDGSPLLHGLGEVVWRREPGDALGRPPGMGIRFVELDREGRELVRRVVAERLRERPVTVGWGEPFEEPRAAEPAAESPGERVFAAPQETEGTGSGGAAGGEEPGEVLDRLPGPEALPPLEPAVELPGDPLADLGRPLPPEASGGGPRAPRGSPLPLVGLALAVVLAIAGFAGWWQRASERGSRVAAPTMPPAAPAAIPTVAMEVGTGGSIWVRTAGSPSPGTATALRRSGAAPVASPTVPVPSTPRADRATAAVTAPPRPTPRPARAVAAIRWRRQGRTTVVTVQPAGALGAGRVRSLRLDDPPRLLLRIRGIDREFPRPEIPVGTRQLLRVRVGLHREFRPPELFVVLDLASPTVRARRRGLTVVLEGE